MAGSSRKLRTDEAFVLRLVEVGDRDAIATLFLASRGKQSVFVKHFSHPKRGFAGRLEILNRLAIRYLPGRRILRLREARLLDPAFAVTSDPARQPACHYAAELVDSFFLENEASPRLFRLLASLVPALREGVAVETACRYIEYWILRLSGHVPSERSCAGCDRPFHIEESLLLGRDGLFCGRCRSRSSAILVRLPPRFGNAIRKLRGRDLGSFVAKPLDAEDAGAVAIFTTTLLVELLGKEPRSLVYMRRYGRLLRAPENAATG